MMDLYSYVAILSKTMIMQGKITYTDTRQRTADCMIGLPLGTELVTGHILAGDEQQAKAEVIAQLKRSHPVDRHYGNHENVTVSRVEETIVEVSC